MEATWICAVYALLCVPCLSFNVPPVVNVTLNCRNYKNFLYWNYSDLLLMPKFKVDTAAFYGKPITVWVDSPNLHKDVSFLNDVEDSYQLTVTAVVGENMSDPAPAEPITFTYYSGKVNGRVCFLDFPPINVTVKPDHTLHIQFPHPTWYYNQQMTSKKKRLQKFSSTVYIQNQKPFGFDCKEQMCEHNILMDEGQKSHCFRIEGQLGFVAAQSTQEYCATAPDRPHNDYIPLYISVALMVSAVLAIVFWMGYKYRTRGASALPGFLHKLVHWSQRPLLETPALSPVTPTSTLLTPIEDVYSPVIVEPEPEVPQCIGVEPPESSASSGLAVATGHGDGYGLGDGLDEVEGEGEEEVEGERDTDSSYTGYGNSGGYEPRRHLVSVEMAPGDHVEGYQV